MSSADPEAFEPLRRFFEHLDPIHACPLRPLRAEVDHGLHRAGGAFEYRLDAAVSEVAHPAIDTRENCSFGRRVPEEDALHAAVNQHPASASVR